MTQPAVPIGTDLGAALGRLPSGLFILTTARAGRDTGLLVSWVQQAGFEPPCVTVALRNDRFIADWVAQSGRFTLNQLAHGQKALIRHFARGFDPEQDAFGGIATRRSEVGGLVLAGALAFLDAEVIDGASSGDHRIVVGRVVGGAVMHPEGEPSVHLRRTGFHY
jgi:flavin reductase (DIM6/NTAB) family NADH-FMN oxidoreductase RutF